MTAEALLTELARLGVAVEADPAGIRIQPASIVPRELKERLRQSKAEVLALLTARAGPLPGVRSWVYPWPIALPGLGRYRVDHFEVCSDCGCGTWSRYGALALCFKCATRRARG